MSHFYDCSLDGVGFLTKLCSYRKTPAELHGVISSTMAHVDAEINILQTFRRELINKNLTPCILELVYHKICDGLSKVIPATKVCERLMLGLEDITVENDVDHVLCTYADLIKGGLFHDRIAFLVLDRCDISLGDYLRKQVVTSVSLAVFKSLLFMIVHAIYTISLIYPKFQHNDLHAGNIMLKFDPNYKFKATNMKFLIFPVLGEKYAVPYFGIVPKIIDFGFSSIPEENIISSNVEDKGYMYHRSTNDLLFLYRWIYQYSSTSGGDKLGRIDKLLQQLEPNRTYVQYYTEYIRSIESKIPTYEQMVSNPVWREYKNVKLQRSQIYNEFDVVEDVPEI